MATRTKWFGALMLFVGLVIGAMLGSLYFGTAEAQTPTTDRAVLSEMQKQTYEMQRQTSALQSLDRNMGRLVTEVSYIKQNLRSR